MTRHHRHKEQTATVEEGAAAAAPAKRGNIAGDLVLGGLAGAAGVWAMDKVGWYLYNRQEPRALARELRARVDGKDVAHMLAQKAARLTGMARNVEQPSTAGIGVHYALGILPGAVHGVVRRRLPVVRAGSGALYGLGLFAVLDEATAPLLGLASAPRRYPWQSHVRGLVSHVVLGMVTETVLRLFDRARKGQ